MFPAGLEPATFRVLGGRDNHYTTETTVNNMTSDTEVFQRILWGPIGDLHFKLENEYEIILFILFLFLLFEDMTRPYSRLNLGKMLAYWFTPMPCSNADKKNRYNIVVSNIFTCLAGDRAFDQHWNQLIKTKVSSIALMTLSDLYYLIDGDCRVSPMASRYPLYKILFKSFAQERPVGLVAWLSLWVRSRVRLPDRPMFWVPQKSFLTWRQPRTFFVPNEKRD